MIMLIVAIDVILSAAVPIAFVIVPFIMDLANGHDVTSDIIVQRPKMKDDLS